MVICPETDLEEALLLAEKVREYVIVADFPTVEHKTVSIGVSSFREGDTEESMINRVDAALYRAKGGGRNQVKY